MKRILCLLMSVIMTFSAPAMTVFAKPVWPSDTGIESEAGIVMDMDSRAVLFGQNINVQKAPASITKLLTALVVIENSELDDKVTFSHEAVYDVEEGSGNKLAMDEGDILTVEDCLYLLLLQSSNQAANALAEHVAESREAFVDMMNKKVEELGCKNSHFANPSGLNDDTQLTTAYDMALIGIAAYDNEKLLEIGSSKSHKIPATKNNPNGASFSMEHKLLTTTDQNSSTYFPDAVAGKTGYTSIAGQTLVTYAKRDDRRLIAVTLKSTAVTHYKDTIALLNFGFDRFQNINIYQNESAAAGEGPVDIGGTTYERADLSIDQSAVITIPRDAAFTDAERVLDTENVEDKKGAVAALRYRYGQDSDGRVVGSVYIISAKKALADEAASAGPEGGADSTEESTESIPASGEGKKAAKSPIRIPVKGVAIAMGILAFAAIICGGFVFIKKKKEAERRMLEERKRRRRQRLQEIGCSEEEFMRMVERRAGSSPKQKSKKKRNMPDDDDRHEFYDI